MSKYFDKDFFKFFLKFAAIISISLMIILAVQMYQQSGKTQAANAVYSVE